MLNEYVVVNCQFRPSLRISNRGETAFFKAMLEQIVLSNTFVRKYRLSVEFTSRRFQATQIIQILQESDTVVNTFVSTQRFQTYAFLKFRNSMRKRI